MKWDDKEKKGYYNHIPGGNREMKSDYYQQKQQAMKDTYTVMEIGGKIVVVVNAPEKPNENEHWPMLAYIEALSDCTKYPTIEADESYWKERIGQRLHRRDLGLYLDDTTYAIPPQQKQDDGDLLEELVKRLLPHIGTFPNTLTVGMAIDCAKAILKHYQLIKRK